MKFPTFLPRVLTSLSFASAIAIFGCADDGLGKRYPVSGTVTYQGKPVEKATISFVNADAAVHSASGTVENGSFTLTTLTEGDGAFPGKYTVTIDARTPDMNAAADAAKKKGNTSGYIPQDFTAKAYKDAKSTLPAKYQASNTSPLKFDVKEQSNSFEIKLED